MTIYFLGGGNMAAAIVAGLCQAERTTEIHVANRGAEKRAALAAKYGVTVSEKLPTLTKNDVLILAVKPQDMQAACENVASSGALVISLAAGLSIATLSRYLGGTQRIIRAMPNTPAQIGLGVTGLFA
ncbi:pyrroline-5-carboxylate reductase family protein, partial [Kingella kingae]